MMRRVAMVLEIRSSGYFLINFMQCGLFNCDES